MDRHGYIYIGFGWHQIPFKFLIFNYECTLKKTLGRQALSFVATALAQTVTSFVQKWLVFKSNAVFKDAIPKYIMLAFVLIIISAALPAYLAEIFQGYRNQCKYCTYAG